jgi:hypothetical protein
VQFQQPDGATSVAGLVFGGDFNRPASLNASVTAAHASLHARATLSDMKPLSASSSTLIVSSRTKIAAARLYRLPSDAGFCFVCTLVPFAILIAARFEDRVPLAESLHRGHRLQEAKRLLDVRRPGASGVAVMGIAAVH